jgi:ABC-type Fe3+/spermidine/putrescine transport system ATPase subunit
MSSVTLERLVKRYGDTDVVKGIDLDIAEGELIVLLGPSGCGKTTTLRMIAGFTTPTSGSIRLGAEVVNTMPPRLRNLGMVFQDYALFPNMTVAGNIGFGLEERGRPRAHVKARVDEMLRLIQMERFAGRYPTELSGGQQQRLALARALAYEPRVLLMDEPLGALDQKLREDMQREFVRIQRRLGITTIFVTHDQVEAMAMSDDILLMRAGNVVQQGAPRDIFLRPASVFAADFMGSGNILPGRIVARDALGGGVATAIGTIACTPPANLSVGAEVCVVIRPHSVFALDDPASDAPDKNVFSGTIAQAQFIGDALETEVDVAGTRVRAMLDPYCPRNVGDTVRIALPRERCVVVPAETAGGADRRPSWTADATPPLMAVA